MVTNFTVLLCLLLCLFVSVESKSSCTLNESTWNCTVYDEAKNKTVDDHPEGDHASLPNNQKGPVTKVEKIDAIFDGLQMLCSQLAKYDNSENDGNSGQEVIDVDLRNPSDGDKEVLQDFNPAIKMLSVESSGLVDGKIQMKVIFRSSTTPELIWFVGYENSSTLHIQGNIQEEIVDGINGTVLAATIDLTDIDILEMCVVNIYTTAEEITSTVNITALKEHGSESIEKFTYSVLKYSPIKVIDKDNMAARGVSTTVRVSNNVIDEMSRDYGRTKAYAILTYINTTSTPHEIHLAWSFAHEAFNVEINNGSDNEIVINIGSELAEFGGILSLRIEQDGTKYLESVRRGVRIRLLQEGADNIMPAGVIAVQRREDVHYYHGQYHSFRCTGVSVPTPMVEVFKVKSDGKLRKLTPDTDTIDGVFHQLSINFRPNDETKPDGNYVCRVSLGNEFVDRKFSIKKYVDIEFDKTKTGIVKNTKRETYLSCKAFGNPVPDIELRINDENGDDIMTAQDERYNVNVMRRKDSMRVLLKVQPANPEISTVICVARQTLNSRRSGPSRYFPIEIKKTRK